MKHCQCLYTCIFVVKIMIILKISNLVFTKIFNNIIINVILINPSVLSAGVILVTLYVKVRFEIFRQMHLITMLGLQFKKSIWLVPFVHKIPNKMSLRLVSLCACYLASVQDHYVWHTAKKLELKSIIYFSACTDINF